MNVFPAFSLLLLVSFVVAAPSNRKKLRIEGRQRRWTATELKEYHEQMRKLHKDYVPNYPDALCTAQVAVGTPPQNFTVSLETGSTAFFLLAENYYSRLPDQPFYDPSRSSTSKLKDSGGYTGYSGDTFAGGDVYSDVVSLFGFDRSAKQQFGVVDEVYGPKSSMPKMPDGILGLSWDPTRVSNPSTESSAVVNLFAEYPEVERFWCQWSKDFSTPEYGREYSTVTEFGGCLEDSCEEVTQTVPLYWWPNSQSLAFLVDGFFYKDQRHIAGFAHADSGFPIIHLPFNVYMEVFWDVYPDYNYAYGVNTVPCSSKDTLPDLTFMVGQTNYSIPASSYVIDLQLPGENQCAWSIDTLDQVNTDYVLGLPFHTAYCIKMDIDHQSIGFSKAITYIPEGKQK